MLRSRSFLALALAACCLPLAACGSDDDSGSTSTAAATGTSAATTTTAAAAFPRTVTDKLGTTEIKAAPERIVTLDFPSTDAVLALGETPVGEYKVSYVDGGIQEWTKAKQPTAPPLLDTDQGFPFEKIAALKPDLIVGTNTYPLVADAADQLKGIAPTVAHVGEPGVDTWQEGLETIGNALGKPDEAKQLEADAEATVAQVRKDHPEFDGKTVGFFNYVPGDGIYVVNDDNDFSIKFLKELGFAGVAPNIKKLKGQTGRAKVSEERYDALDADILIGTSPDPKALKELESSKLFQAIPAVKDGHFLSLDIGPATAMAFPSVLSVPWAAEQLAPQLADKVSK
jgi:iron complex transport system substrate-binding protein